MATAPVKRIMRVTLAGAVVLAGAAGGWYWWTEARYIVGTDDAYVHGDITQVSPRVDGTVAEVAVGDNQPVKAGDVVVRIDDRDRRARLEAARADVAARNSALATIDARIALQASVIAGADAALAGARAEVARARLDLDRTRHLVKDDFATRQRHDTATADAAKAEAAVQRARAELSVAELHLAVLKAERHEQEARLNEAEAKRDGAAIELDHTILRAPVDGIVGNRGVRVGQYVRPGTPLLAVVPLRTVWVVANFKETQIAELASGQSAQVSVDAYPGRAIAGRVASFSPAAGSQFTLLPAENASGNFTKVVQRIPVRIDIPTDSPLAGPLRPGMSVEVGIDTRTGGP